MKHNGQNFLIIFMVIVILFIVSAFMFEDEVSVRTVDPYPGPEVTVTVGPYPAPEQPTATPKPKKNDDPTPTIEKTSEYRPTSAPTEANWECGDGGIVIFNDEGDAACYYDG